MDRGFLVFREIHRFEILVMLMTIMIITKITPVEVKQLAIQSMDMLKVLNVPQHTYVYSSRPFGAIFLILTMFMIDFTIVPLTPARNYLTRLKLCTSYLLPPKSQPVICFPRHHVAHLLSTMYPPLTVLSLIHSPPFS